MLPPFLAAVLPPVRGSQATDSLIHAAVVVLVVLCATGLRAAHAIDSITVGNIYAGAIGYAAGRSGVSGARRAGDSNALPPSSPDD